MTTGWCLCYCVILDNGRLHQSAVQQFRTQERPQVHAAVPKVFFLSESEAFFCPSVAFYKLKSRVQVTVMVSVSITLVMSRLHLSHKQYYSVLMHHVEKEGCEQVEFFIAVFSFSTHLWFWFLYKENDLLELAFLVLHSFGVCVTLSRRRAFVSNIEKNCKTQSWVRLSEISAPVMSWCCPPEGSIVSSHLLLISG